MNIKGQRDKLLATLKAMTDKPPAVEDMEWGGWECAYCGGWEEELTDLVNTTVHKNTCQYILGRAIVEEVEKQIIKEGQCTSEQSSSAV